MAEIQLKSLAHSYIETPTGAEDYAIRQLDHVWEKGGAYALLGPSGCGKSTMLNIISGLLEPSEGDVLFDGRRVNELSPRERNIAQVFQFPVIYDSMTVFDNLAFPLKNNKLPSSQIKARVHEIAEVLEIEDKLYKKAKNLTADEKQKVSMGRGLVREDVSAILFDEPLTVIDPQLKWKLRRKLKQIHEKFDITMVYVTHDQLEASTFADKIAVMYGGQIVQFGTPHGVVRTPEPHLCRLFHRQSRDEPDSGGTSARRRDVQRGVRAVGGLAERSASTGQERQHQDWNSPGVHRNLRNRCGRQPRGQAAGCGGSWYLQDRHRRAG